MISQASALEASAFAPSSGNSGFRAGSTASSRERTSAATVERESAAHRPGRRRARQVSAFERACAFVFGSPSLRRANGGAEASFAPSRSGSAAKRRLETPVFEIDRRGVDAAERLPRVWVSEPCFRGSDGAFDGRAFTCVYPNGSDALGTRALDLANRYLGAAHACESNDHVRRCACFRAAEILLLHAAERRNVEAYELLAWIYEHDACEGVYWASELELRAAHGSRLSPAQRALEWRAKAVARGYAPSCCALADKLASLDAPAGDQLRAYRLYRRVCDGALLSSRDCSEADFGTALLGLARCSELGIGCAQSFIDALEGYRAAYRLLSAALDAGAWSLKRAVHDARCGMARMRQEIDGCH